LIQQHDSYKKLMFPYSNYFHNSITEYQDDVESIKTMTHLM